MELRRPSDFETSSFAWHLSGEEFLCHLKMEFILEFANIQTEVFRGGFTLHKNMTLKKLKFGFCFIGKEYVPPRVFSTPRKKSSFSFASEIVLSISCRFPADSERIWSRSSSNVWTFLHHRLDGRGMYRLELISIEEISTRQANIDKTKQTGFWHLLLWKWWFQIYCHTYATQG